MLRWVYRGYSFWGLACHVCGGCAGWRTSYCGWRVNSCVAAVACRCCGARQFLKKYRQSGVDSKRRALSEYEVLRHLNGGIGSKPPFLLPQVYSFAATTWAFSMEYIQGSPLDERMRRAADRQRFDECLRESATWLQGLHRAALLHVRSGNNNETMLRRLESDCGFLASRSAIAAQALILMRGSLDAINSLPTELVPLHGDFKASNLIWTERGVYGVDVDLRFKNPWVMDAAQFIADVLLNRRYIKIIAGDRDIAPIVDVFLEAYSDNSQENRNLTCWWLLYFLLSSWQSNLEGWKPAMLVDQNHVTAVTDVMALCDRNKFAMMGQGAKQVVASSD